MANLCVVIVIDQVTLKMNVIILDPEAAGPLLEDEDRTRYHSAVSSINYTVTYTRPDLAFAALILS